MDDSNSDGSPDEPASPLSVPLTSMWLELVHQRQSGRQGFRVAVKGCARTDFFQLNKTKSKKKKNMHLTKLPGRGRRAVHWTVSRHSLGGLEP